MKQHTKLSLAVLVLAHFWQPSNAQANTIVSQWNDAALQAIRTTHPGPPIVARALAIAHTCMFDAWSAYDLKAQGTRYGKKLRRPSSEYTQANKEKAISYAAYQCLVDLFPSEQASFLALMTAHGFAPSNSQNLATPEGVGNVAAKAVINFRHNDGANQLGNLHPGAYSDYTGYAPVNTPSAINDPNHWQPLNVNGKSQAFITPHWGNVKPYALRSSSQYESITPAPADYFTEPERYEIQAQQVLEYSAHLTDEKKSHC